MRFKRINRWRPQWTSVKVTRKLTILITGFTIIFCAGFMSENHVKNEEEVDKWFSRQLLLFRESVEKLRLDALAGKSKSELKAGFFEARKAYKKLSVLTDYFNVYETRDLNGAVLPRVEEDNPQTILQPHGLQVIEELLFAKKLNRQELAEEAVHILKTISRLETEPDRIYKFREGPVWDAIRSAVARLMTLGIAGFDSPVAGYHLKESASVLDGIREIALLYEEKNAAFNKMIASLESARQFLEAQSSPRHFNSLAFISGYANPLYAAVITARKKLGIRYPEERRPVNLDDSSLFSSSFFDLRFYSPNARYGMTTERIELGRRLFYDPILSGNNRQSCAGCHKPEKAFTDGLPQAIAFDGVTVLLRNTPTVLNSVLQTRQFYDSRVSTLENQLSAVVHNEKEMKGSLRQSVLDLQRQADYKALFQKAYPNDREAISEYTIANAISSYIRSLVALNSRFDRYMRGETTVLNHEEKSGFNLYMGKAKCATCHFLPLFNGLVPPEFTETESEVLGVPSPQHRRRPDQDEGKYGFTRAEIHRYSFKTPTLRNVELTAPYMHNGAFSTLEEVMDFYNKGGGGGLGFRQINQTLPAQKLHLTRREKQQVILFLKTLTDTVMHR